MHKRLLSIKMLSFVVAITASLFLLLSLLPRVMTVNAEEPTLQQAPVQLVPAGSPPVINGHGTGYRPPPMDLSHLTGQTMPQVP